MTDIKEFVTNGGVLVSGYINGDKNFNVYNGFDAPTKEQEAQILESATQMFGKGTKVSYETYKDEKSIQGELDRQISLKKEIEAKSNQTQTESTKK